MKYILGILVILLALGSNSKAAPPEPETSEYFHTEGGGFMITGEDNERIVQFAVSLKIRKKIPKGAVIVFKFENPLDSKSPLIKEIQYDGKEEKLSVNSPAVWGLKPNNIYLYAALIYTSRAKKTLLASHSQKLLFGMTDEMYDKFLKPWYENRKK